MPAKSQAQQKFMGIVHAIQKGDAKPSEFSKDAQQAAKEMKPSDAKDFASTKHAGLPKKVGKESIEAKLKETIRQTYRESLRESVNEAYPTDLKVGSVILGQGFTMLKGIEGGKYYKVVDMDNYSATLVPSDKSGNVKGSKKVRHKLDSIEGGIKTAKRGDENGIVVIKESINEAVSHEAMGIASMTNTRKEAVQKFIDDNNLDAQEILKVVTKGGLVERVRFIQALVGTPGNSSFKWYVKTYTNESVNEASLSWKDVDKYANAISNLTQIDTKDVKKFIEDNKLNIEKIFAIAHKTSQGKTDFVKAIKAAPNSSIQNAYIKTYANESVVKESDEPSDIIKDLDKLRNDLIKKVEVLIAKKKKLYSDVDITTPMSADEKQLDKDIQSIFSQIQQIIQQKRKINK